MAAEHNQGVRILIAGEQRGDPSFTLRAVGPDARSGPVLSGLTPAELAERVAALEEQDPAPRWVLPATGAIYPVLLRAGVPLRRAHDLALAEGILLAHRGHAGEPKALPAAYARAAGQQPPPDPEPEEALAQPALFETRRSGLPAGVEVADAAETVLAAQDRELEHSAGLRMLVWAESGSALAAEEMTHHGLPWRADVHDQLLSELLGPRVTGGVRPKRLAELAAEIEAAFGRPVNPDHPPTVARAFSRAGIDVPSTRAWVLKDIDHPAVAPLLEYKELARLHTAHGWSWLERWVSDGRFRPLFVVGGVVSGRWASRGGGALQVPRALRVCVRADPGWRLVVADAAQLEPRVLAALSGDRRFAEVAGEDDLYAGIAAEAFDGDRARAKLALISAMYGGTSGEAGALLAVLRKRFPDAVHYVERAALAGERGELVRSRLGRTSPPPSERWRALTGASAEDGTHALRASREWGRFTRNFVVQASAADWTAVLLALLRLRLAERAPGAQLVFFMHDEVIVHCPEDVAEVVREELANCAREAAELIFGSGRRVSFPLLGRIVECYADRE